MFRYCFTHKQNRSITRSKYSQGVAKITDEICDDIITAARVAGIDLDLALSPAQQREKQQKTEVEATAISYGLIKPGDFEGHNFEEEQSLTTLNTKRSKMARSLASNTLAKSLYSIGSTKGGNNKGSNNKDKEENRQTN